MLHLIIILVIIGVILYLVNRYVPMDAKIKTILNWVVIIAVILWLLSVFGVFNMADIPINGGAHHAH